MLSLSSQPQAMRRMQMSRKRSHSPMASSSAISSLTTGTSANANNGGYDEMYANSRAKRRLSAQLAKELRALRITPPKENNPFHAHFFAHKQLYEREPARNAQAHLDILNAPKSNSDTSTSSSAASSASESASDVRMTNESSTSTTRNESASERNASRLNHKGKQSTALVLYRPPLSVVSVARRHIDDGNDHSSLNSVASNSNMTPDWMRDAAAATVKSSHSQALAVVPYVRINAENAAKRLDEQRVLQKLPHVIPMPWKNDDQQENAVVVEEISDEEILADAGTETHTHGADVEEDCDAMMIDD